MKPLKIIFMGDTNVGKSSIVHYMIYQESYTYRAHQTISAAFHVKTINDKKIHIWDTAGQEKYRSFVNIYYRDSHGAIVVFDLTDRSSFKHLSQWINDFRIHNPNQPIIILGNKSDLPNRQVSLEEVKDFADDLSLKFFITNTLDGSNILTALHSLIDMIEPPLHQSINFDLNKEKNDKSSFFQWC